MSDRSLVAELVKLDRIKKEMHLPVRLQVKVMYPEQHVVRRLEDHIARRITEAFVEAKLFGGRSRSRCAEHEDLWLLWGSFRGR